MKPAIVILIVIGALQVAGCTSGAVTAQTQPPTNEQAPSAAADAAGPRSETIPDGTWQSVRTRDAAKRAGLSDPEIDGAIGEGNQAAFSLSLAAGRYSIFVAPDVGKAEVGDLGTYEYREDGVLATTSESEGCPSCVLPITWSVDGDTLSLTLDHDRTTAERFVIDGTWTRLP